MWTKLKALFSSNVDISEQQLDSNFAQQVRDTINLFENKDILGSDEEVIEYLTSNGIGEIESSEILLFLPIAFVRKLLPTIKWSQTFIEYTRTKKRIRKKYHDVEAFQIIWQITTLYFQTEPNKDTILKIAGRSAEYNSINQLLLENPVLEVEEILLSDTLIIRG